MALGRGQMEARWEAAMGIHAGQERSDGDGREGNGDGELDVGLREREQGSVQLMSHMATQG